MSAIYTSADQRYRQTSASERTHIEKEARTRAGQGAYWLEYLNPAGSVERSRR